MRIVRYTRTLLILAAGLLLCACSRAAQAPPNVALSTAGAQVYVSSAPNPAWPPAQAVDGLVDTTHGWIASADKDTQPWIALEFAHPVRVGSIIFYQAGLTEGGENRFARPRKLRILMDGIEPRIVTLEDRERVPQRLELEPVDTGVLKIDILDTYEDARFPFLAGFQEIEVYEAGLEVGGPVAKKQPEDAAGDAQAADPLLDEIHDTVESAGRILETKQDAPAHDGTGTAGLDPAERELLDLLRAFTAKLEQYMQDN